MEQERHKPGKALGELSETIEGVDVRGLSPAGNGGGVESHGLVGEGPGLVLVGVIEEETHGVANEILGSGLQAKFLVDL